MGDRVPRRPAARAVRQHAGARPADRLEHTAGGVVGAPHRDRHDLRARRDDGLGQEGGIREPPGAEEQAGSELLAADPEGLVTGPTSTPRRRADDFDAGSVGQRSRAPLAPRNHPPVEGHRRPRLAAP